MPSLLWPQVTFLTCLFISIILGQKIGIYPRINVVLCSQARTNSAQCISTWKCSTCSNLSSALPPTVLILSRVCFGRGAPPCCSSPKLDRCTPSSSSPPHVRCDQVLSFCILAVSHACSFLVLWMPLLHARSLVICSLTTAGVS